MFVWVCWVGLSRLLFVRGEWFVLIGLICWCGLECSCRSGSCCLMVVSVDCSGSFLCYGDVLYKIIGAGYERVSNQWVRHARGVIG